ncbi:MAG TPA: amidinotransferase, partial [Thermoanaerobaculia bacterium]
MLQPLARELPVVHCHNEWDPLEEVIVGVVDGACVPPWHVSLKATMPRDQWSFFRENGGKPFPPHLIDAARRELDGFVRLLEAEGVTVRRPEIVDWSRP